MAYETVTPIVPNTTMEKYINNNNVFSAYRITPLSGYVLHDTQYDTPVTEEVVDEETGEITIVETGEVILGYCPVVVSCEPDYDFTTTEMQDEAGNTVTAYGERQFFTKLATDVPTDQIFGVVDQPEVM